MMDKPLVEWTASVCLREVSSAFENMTRVLNVHITSKVGMRVIPPNPHCLWICWVIAKTYIHLSGVPITKRDKQNPNRI